MSIEKRSQAERMAVASSLLEGLWEEIRKGEAENILQEAVYAQQSINRIVWKLNEKTDEVRNGNKG